VPQSDLPHYASWRDVPPGTYLTKTQLGELEFPRTPGPPAATVDGWNYRDKKATFDLYRIDESQPTNASAKTLAAARSRSGGQDRYTCTDCGCHPERPVTVYQDGPQRCQACAHIRTLRLHQADMARRREHVSWHIRDLLAGPLAVAHFELAPRGHTPAGTERPPGAVRIHAIDSAGQTLTDTTVRLVGPRSKGVPDHAVDAAQAAIPLREALAERVLAYWPDTGLGSLQRALHAASFRDVIPSGYGRTLNLREQVLIWRADMNPEDYGWRGPIAPGRADRMLYLLQRMAASAGGVQGVPEE
jgi:hypothetical protein